MIDFLQPEEQIISIQRRHWFYLVMSLLGSTVIAGLILVSPIFFEIFAPEVLQTYFLEVLFMVVLAFEVVWLVVFYTLIDYYLDYWVVTDRRLVLIELQGVFNRKVESVDLRNVQDISTKVFGLFPMLLDFGDVVVQSAGTHGQFLFQQVPNPGAVRDEILRAREAWIKTST